MLACSAVHNLVDNIACMLGYGFNPLGNREDLIIIWAIQSENIELIKLLVKH